MRILIFDEDLMWSVRLKSGLEKLGHGVEVFDKPGAFFGGDVAILNLSSNVFSVESLVRDLHCAGVYCIAHAGHKEGEKLAAGVSAGVDFIVTNGELARKLEHVIEKVASERLIRLEQSG